MTHLLYDVLNIISICRTVWGPRAVRGEVVSAAVRIDMDDPSTIVPRVLAVAGEDTLRRNGQECLCPGRRTGYLVRNRRELGMFPGRQIATGKKALTPTTIARIQPKCRLGQAHGR